VAELVPQVTGATVGTSGQVGLAVTASTPTRKFISASVVGTTANYLAAKQQTVAVGRFFTESEAGTGARVAVLGPLIGRALFGPNPGRPGSTVRRAGWGQTRTSEQANRCCHAVIHAAR
jgi:putative ABC transport system permease protein